MLSNSDIKAKLKREGTNLNEKFTPISKKMKMHYASSEMTFYSKPEAYTYCIYLLSKWCKNYNGELVFLLKKCIEFFKLSYENHEQNVSVIVEKLSEITGLNSKDQKKLELLKDSLDRIENNITNDNNILARRFESELACQIIKSPTQKMMEAVHNVSIAIIKVIEDYCDHDEPKYKEVLDFFLRELEGSDILFGTLKETPTLEKVIGILKENNPQDFIRIQFISFMFSRAVIGPLPLKNLPVHAPTGLFQKILNNYVKIAGINDKDEPFSYQRMAAKEDAVALRTFITSQLFYGDDLYTQGVNRGRKGPRKTHLNTNQLGLMKLNQSAHSEGLSFIPDQLWCADAQAQDADENSIYYLTALNNDCPYITGPSGMTSLFMNMMFLLVNPEDIETIQAYSLAVVAYIVGAGFHSINEIIIPLIKCIDLLPDYPTYQGLEYLKLPPLYHLYFKTLGLFDAEFWNIREETWKEYLSYFEIIYMPLCMSYLCKKPQILDYKKTSSEVDILKQIISESIDNCIQYHKQNSTYDLGFLANESPDIAVLNRLKTLCEMQFSLLEIMAQLQKYFAGDMSSSLTNMHKCENRSYLRFFLDVLKDYPQILAHLNVQLNLGSPLIISPNCDIFSSHFKLECFKIHKILKERVIMDNPQDVHQMQLRNI
ncbi:MAG: hypothetical protein H0U57_13865 [Tatlockia sp.]|nr:hypothetical protein [Tatlockia sp.]